MSAIASKPKRTFYTGILSEIALLHLGDGAMVMSAILTREVDGGEVRTPIAAAGPVLDAIRDQCYEDAEVTFFGQVGDATFVVLGPDLRRSTLIAQGVAVPPRPVRIPEARRRARRAYFAARHRRNAA